MFILKRRGTTQFGKYVGMKEVEEWYVWNFLLDYRVIRLKVVKSKLLWLFMWAFLTPCGKDQNVFDYWQFHFDTGCILGI